MEHVITDCSDPINEVIKMLSPQDGEIYARTKRTLGNEIAWEIQDVGEVMAHILNSDRIILGGDVLHKNLTYTLDNWYYRPLPGLSHEDHVSNSYDVAIQYVDEYMLRYGTEFYVVVVTEKG